MIRAITFLVVVLLSVIGVEAGVIYKGGITNSGMDADAIAALNKLGSSVNFNFTVTSGHRTPGQNAAAGGATNSQHLHGDAFDVRVSDLSQEQRAQLTEAALKNGFGGIGFYGENGHLHLDTAGTRTWGTVPSWAKDAMQKYYGKVDRKGTAGDPDNKSGDKPQNQPNYGQTATNGTNTTNTASNYGSNTGSTDKISQMVSSLMDKCWSCEVYKKIYQGSTQLVSEAFNYLTRTQEIAAVAALILMIVLAVKILKMVSTPFAPAAGAEWSRIFGYIGRIFVVFLFFFGEGAVDAMRSGEEMNTSGRNPVRMLFIDGPTGIGTEIGCAAIKAAANSGLGGGSVSAKCDSSQGYSEFGNAESTMKYTQLNQAMAILEGQHKISIQGLAVSIWLATEAPFKLGASNIIPAIGVCIAGITMAAMFFWLSITFGMRYIDALVRTTIMAALMPFFLYLWIFEATRGMAVRALKTLTYVGAVFAASGIVFIMADQVMCAGISRALGGSCTNFAEIVSGGGFNQLVGNDGIGWIAIFILLGTAGLVIQVTKSVFSLANVIVETQVSTDAGAQAAGAVQSGATQVVAAPMSMVRR